MNSIVLKKAVVGTNLLFGLIFLYFFTTSADLLHLQLPLFRVKINHLIALGLCGVVLLHHRKLEIDRKLFFSLGGIGVAMFASLFFSAYLPRSLAHFALFGFTVLVYFLLPLNLMRLYGRKTILSLYRWAFLATGGFALLQFFCSWFGVAFPFVSQYLLGKIARAQAMTFEPSYFALYMSAFVMYWNAKYLTTKEKGWSKAIFVNLLLLVSTSTGALFSYFFFLFTVLFFQRLSWIQEFKACIWKKVLLLSTCLLLLFLAILGLAPDLFRVSFWKFFVQGFLSHHSFAERWEGIVNAWDLFLQHPWFGVGIGGIGPLLYKEIFAQEMIATPTIAILELYDPTNVLTEVFAALGLCGVAAFALFIYNYWKSYSLIAKSPEVPIEEKKELYALLVSLCVMLLVWQFNQNLFRSYIWVHAAICLGYAKSLKSELKDN